MLFTSRKQYLAKNAREIYIGEDCNLPQLHRLCSDFGFAVLGLSGNSATPKSYILCEVDLVKNANEAPERVSPEFASLAELEVYAASHIVTIVQKYLFGDDALTSGDDSIAVA